AGLDTLRGGARHTGGADRRGFQHRSGRAEHGARGVPLEQGHERVHGYRAEAGGVGAREPQRGRGREHGGHVHAKGHVPRGRPGGLGEARQVRRLLRGRGDGGGGGGVFHVRVAPAGRGRVHPRGPRDLRVVRPLRHRASAVVRVVSSGERRQRGPGVSGGAVLVGLPPDGGRSFLDWGREVDFRLALVVRIWDGNPGARGLLRRAGVRDRRGRG
ncbi:unnamed protein product, partial [Ectocarpus fasciculatus]